MEKKNHLCLKKYQELIERIKGKAEAANSDQKENKEITAETTEAEAKKEK